MLQLRSKMTNNNHYFQLKGKQAEEIVHELGEKTFLTDWCYPNPKWADGKELCDLLVVFDDIAIIFQIKHLKCDATGEFNQSEIQKNNNQLIGARRHLFELKKSISLANPRRGNESFNSKDIKEVFLISIIFGENKSFCFGGQDNKNYFIHVFDEQFTDIIFNELDTISDFIEYLRKKQILITTGPQIIVNGGEEELLAYYLLNNREFNKFNKATHIIIESGSWEHLKNKNEYKRKKIEDKVSYGWDGIINRAHEGSHQYELVARELARPSRFQRRYLSKRFLELHLKAHKGAINGAYRSLIPIENVTYCFLFQNDEEPRINRQAMLGLMCQIARVIIKNNKKVIGIATETKLQPISSYDFVLLDIPDPSKEFIEKAEEAKKETGIFNNLVVRNAHEDEYPISEEDGNNK